MPEFLMNGMHRSRSTLALDTKPSDRRKARIPLDFLASSSKAVETK